MMSEEDIWAGMDMSSGTGGIASRSATPGVTFSAEISSENMETDASLAVELDTDDDVPPFAGLQPDAGAISDDDAFVASMMSHEWFPESENLLLASPAAQKWIREQLHADHNPYSEDHNRLWLKMCGERMPMDKVGCRVMAYICDWWMVMREVYYPNIVLPISHLLRAIDLFVVCKAVAYGLHEAPVIDHHGNMEDMPDAWIPVETNGGSFLPRFSEDDFVEAAINVFIKDAQQRACLPIATMHYGKLSRIVGFERHIYQLLYVEQMRGLIPELLLPTDAFTWRVVEHLRGLVADLLVSTLGHLLPKVVESLIVSYTMDVRTEVDFYIANALNGNPEVNGGAAAFIQVLHVQMENSIYSFRPKADNITMHDWHAVSQGNHEDVGFTTDFLGSIFAPLPDRIPRLSSIDLHSAMVAQVAEFSEKDSTRDKCGQLTRLANIDHTRRRRWQRDLKFKADRGLNLIVTYPAVCTQLRTAVQMVRLQIMSLGTNDERNKWKTVMMSQLDRIQRNADAGMKPMELQGFKKEMKTECAVSPEPATPPQMSKSQSPFSTPLSQASTSTVRYNSDSDYSPSSQSSNSDDMEYGA